MIKDLCFEIIETCPNNCLFCSSCSSLDKLKMIDIEVFKKVIDHLVKKGGIEEISLSGGEPLLHPYIFEMIKYCKEKNIRVVLFTSGIVKNDNRYLGYLNPIERRIIKNNSTNFKSISKQNLLLLKEMELDRIVFDFQGAEVDTYNYLMGTKNQFTYIADSMLRASMIGLDVDVHFIPLKPNYKEFKDIIEILEICGIKKISVLNFVPQGRGEDNQDRLMLSNEEMLEFIKIYESVKDKFSGVIRVGIPLLSKDTHLCTAGLDKMVIKYDGTVLPCPAFKEYDTLILNKMGIKTPNIYTDLEKLEIHNGTRKKPLCKQLYGFDKSLK
mgnify:FL=1